MRTNATFLTYVWKCTSKCVRSNSCHTVNGLRTIVRPHCVSTRSSDRKWLKPAGSDTGIKVYNSLTKQKEPLILAEEGIAKWYVIRKENLTSVKSAINVLLFRIIQHYVILLFEGTPVDLLCMTMRILDMHGNDL